MKRGAADWGTWLAMASLLLAGAPAGADAPYSPQLSALAQRYYRQCRAEKRLLDQFANDLNDRRLPMPPYHSFREDLAPADRRDAELVCLGAVLQQFDDMRDQWKRAQIAPAPEPPPPPAGKGTAGPTRVR